MAQSRYVFSENGGDPYTGVSPETEVLPQASTGEEPDAETEETYGWTQEGRR